MFRLNIKYLINIAAMKALPGGRGCKRGILLLNLDRIGDVYMLIPTLPYFMKLLEPGETLTLLTQVHPDLYRFMLPEGVIAEQLPYEQFRKELKFRRKFMRNIKARNYRLVLDPVASPRHPFVNDMVIVGSGATSIAYRSPIRGDKFVKLLDYSSIFYDKVFEVHLRHRTGYQLDFINKIKPGIAPRFVPFPLDQGLKRNRNVYLHPFSVDKSKQYPVAYWAELIKAIPAGYNLRLSCLPSDLQANPEWIGLCEEFALTKDSSSLEEKYQAFQQAALLITVDTSILHLASFTAVPFICLATEKYRNLAAPFPPEVTAPHMHFHTVSCEHSHGRCNMLSDCVFPREGDEPYPCLRDIDRSKVIADIRSILA